MATEGSELFDDAWVIGTIEATAGIPAGPLVDVLDAYGAEMIVGSEFKNRFPTPPSAWGFLIDVDAELTFGLLRSTTMGGQFTGGALAPGSELLEPTLGQIWPR